MMKKFTINKIVIMGVLCKNPDVSETHDKRPVASFTVETFNRWKDKEGNYRDRREWHLLVAYGRYARVVKNHLKKDSECYIEGSLRTNKWIDKEGIARYKTEVVVDKVELTGGELKTG